MWKLPCVLVHVCDAATTSGASTTSCSRSPNQRPSSSVPGHCRLPTCGSTFCTKSTCLLLASCGHLLPRKWTR